MQSADKKEKIMSCKYCEQLNKEEANIKLTELKINYQDIVSYECPVNYCPNCGDLLLNDTDNYGFRTIQQIVDKIRERNREVDTEPLGFTLDTPEDVYVGFEPTGWYGITLSNLFDATSVLIGEYGVGVLYSDDVESNGMSIEESLIEFIDKEKNIKVDENYRICIDPEEWR